MLLTAVMKSLKGKVTISLSGDHLCLALSNVEIRFTSGFPFANVLLIVEQTVLAG